MSLGLFNIQDFSGLSDRYSFKKHVITRAKKQPDEPASTPAANVSPSHTPKGKEQPRKGTKLFCALSEKYEIHLACIECIPEDGECIMKSVAHHCAEDVFVLKKTDGGGFSKVILFKLITNCLIIRHLQSATT